MSFRVCANKGITSTSWVCVRAGGFKLWEGAIDPCNHQSHMCWQQRQHVVSVFNVCAGGFKLWEGAIDLCNYLISQHQLTPDGLARGETSLRVGWLCLVLCSL